MLLHHATAYLEDAGLHCVAFCGLAEQAGLHARQLARQGCRSSAEGAASSGLAEAGAAAAARLRPKQCGPRSTHCLGHMHGLDVATRACPF